MRATCRRLGDGQAIRDAMRDRQVKLTELAERTKELDPDSRGVSYQLIGFLTLPSGKSARSTVSPKSAELIALALGCPVDKLFERTVTALRRAGNGKPIRDTMRERETTFAALADRTRELDPASRGVAQDILERLANRREQEPPVITQRDAALIAQALDCAEGRLFESVASAMPTGSTHAGNQVSAA